MSLIDDFESAFQACLSPITNPTSSHVFDNDELKANVDNIQRFLDVSRQVESFFIQKRAILADQKPELLLTEEISEIKNEILRKDNLLNKYYDKLNKWSTNVNDVAAGKPTSITTMPMNQMVPNMVPLRMNQPAHMPQTVPKGQFPGNSMMHSPSPMMRPQNPQIQLSQPTHQMALNQNINHGGLQGPLAYLERTTAHIGRTDNRR